MAGPAEPSQNFTSRLHGLAQAGLQYARARIDLLQRELQQERTRILGVMARAAIFAVGVVVSYQMLALFILVAFWDTAYRLYAAGGLALLTVGITFGAWRAMRAGRSEANQPFAVSIAEIDKDRVVLERLADMAETAKAKPPATTAVTPPKTAAVKPVPAPVVPAASSHTASETSGSVLSKAQA